jgi:hypothetical protein
LSNEVFENRNRLLEHMLRFIFVAHLHEQRSFRMSNEVADLTAGAIGGANNQIGGRPIERPVAYVSDVPPGELYAELRSASLAYASG